MYELFLSGTFNIFKPLLTMLTETEESETEDKWELLNFLQVW